MDIYEFNILDIACDGLVVTERYKQLKFKPDVVLMDYKMSTINGIAILPPLLGWTVPSFLSWQAFLDYIKTSEGLITVIISQGIPVICVTIGAIFLLIFLIKLIRGKE